MLSQDDAAPPAKSADTGVALVVLTQLTIITAQASLSWGVKWEALLHWAGEALLVAGIILAAKGISDVRREWTSRPGILGSAAKTWGRASTLFWRGWNKAVERWPRLAGWLRLHIHLTLVPDGDRGQLDDSQHVSTGFRSEWYTQPSGGTPEERLAWLEARIARAGADIGTLYTWHHQEVRDRQAATEGERAAREAEDRRVRQDLADLAGGGLRLQAWGVVCLLAGTVLTAIW